MWKYKVKKERALVRLNKKNKRNCRSRTYHISIMLTPMNYFPFIKALVNCADYIFWWKNILVVKNPLLFLTFIYILYILSHYKRKKTGKLTKNPYKWLNHAGLRVFQNWPKTDHLPTFSDHLPTFSLSKNIKSTAWTEISDHLPTFSDQKLTTKIQKERALVRLRLY